VRRGHHTTRLAPMNRNPMIGKKRRMAGMACNLARRTVRASRRAQAALLPRHASARRRYLFP
jgi:hypothetical protein